MSKRFVLIEGNVKYPIEEDSQWYYDTGRPLEGEQPFVAVQCYKDRDPNGFQHVSNLRVLFTDQAEYYMVCPSCYSTYYDYQWSGSTYQSGWQSTARKALEAHQTLKGWCEFCDPAFGNGGWTL